jgi:hypothetical protein
MFAILYALGKVVADLVKSRARLEAEILLHQLKGGPVDGLEIHGTRLQTAVAWKTLLKHCQRFANETRKPNENKRTQSTSDSSGFTGFFRFRCSLIVSGWRLESYGPTNLSAT